jgi:hypothetical protein
MEYCLSIDTNCDAVLTSFNPENVFRALLAVALCFLPRRTVR